MTALYVWWLQAHGMILRITLFEAAMGPAISAGIVASDAGLNPPLVTLVVAIGIALSFLTLPVWWCVLGAV
jgi:predicted permease